MRAGGIITVDRALGSLMRRLGSLVIPVVLTACGSSATPSTVEPMAIAAPRTVPVPAGLAVREIGGGAWIVTQIEPWSSNVLVVRTEDGTILIVSTPSDDVPTRNLMTWTRAALGPGRLVAINTHHHLDGVGGNAALRSAGAEIIASTHTAELIAQRGIQVRDGVAATMKDPAIRERIARLEIVPPMRTFAPEAGLVLDLGEPVHVVFPGPNHAADHVVVWLPRRSVLYGGCMVRALDAGLGYLGDADLERWPAAIARLQALGASHVVPGHGDAGGPELLDHTATLLAKRASKT